MEGIATLTHLLSSAPVVLGAMVASCAVLLVHALLASRSEPLSRRASRFFVVASLALFLIFLSLTIFRFHVID
jgi:heme O synthase-like polyprenyltransferase